MLSGESQHRILPRYQNEEKEIINISLPRLRIEPTTYHILTKKMIYHNSSYLDPNDIAREYRRRLNCVEDEQHTTIRLDGPGNQK